jgi:hypothetical protein
MKFELLFGDGDGATKLVEVMLTAAEVEAAKAHARPDICAQAIALHHGYKQVPLDWRHYSDRIKQIQLN